MKKTLIITGLTAGLMLVTSAPLAHADSTGLELVSGTSSDALTVNAVPGYSSDLVLDFNGWQVTVSSESYPFLGTPANPQITTTSIDVVNTDGTGAPLDIFFSQTAYTAIANGVTALAVTSLTGGLSASYSSFYNAADTVLTNATLVAASTQIGSTIKLSSVSAGVSGGPFGDNSPYSLGQEIVISGGAPGSSIGLSASLGVPDNGSTVSLLGLGVLGLVGIRSRIFRKTATA